LRYLGLVLLLALTSCDRHSSLPIGVPPDATVLLVAPSLGELRTLSEFVEPLPVKDAGDEAKPAWFACEAELCVLRRAASVKDAHKDGVWHVADGDGSLVVWGAKDRDALDAALSRWRTGAPAPPVPPSYGWTGFFEPRPLLATWKPSKPRARELVERATFQAGRIDFQVKTAKAAIDAELSMRPVSGEPSFVSDLGDPTGDSPDVAGLTTSDMLGMARLSADPARLWTLLRSLLSAEHRGELDEFVAKLDGEAALSVDAVLAALSGHVYVVAYATAPGSAHTPIDWLTLDATQEALLIGVRDRQTVRRALDAWTQLSKHRLRVHETRQVLQWAWFEGEQLRWTAELGADYLLIMDGPAALDAAQRWKTTPSPLAKVLVERGVDSLLQGNRSGVYVDLTAVREHLGGVLPRVESIAVSAENSPDGELVGVRVKLEQQ
jgi:hypothetical protein